MQTNQLTHRPLESMNANQYTFASDPSPHYPFPPNLQETLQSIISSRLSSAAINTKTSSESLEQKSWRKCQKHKKDDLERLQKIAESIDIFCCSTNESEKKLKALYEIGKFSGEIKFNDLKEHKEKYLRNKYGSVDRSNSSKPRLGGLELIHLNALQHIAALALNASVSQVHTTKNNLYISEQEYSSLIPDFELIKKKIQFISKDAAYTPEEIDEEFKTIGVAKSIQTFVNKNYTALLIAELTKNLKDQELQNLDFTKREDRYYLGRTLSMIGELSKDIKNFLNPEGKKSGSLFSFFKKIRDDKLAHYPLALVKDISPEKIPQFNLLLALLKKFESIVENLETNGLGETTESEGQQLNKLIDSIFGKKMIVVDPTILNGIGKFRIQEPKNIKNSISGNLEKSALKKRNLITTIEQINNKVCLLDGRLVVSQKKATEGQEVIKKPTRKQSNILQQEIQRLIVCYNETDIGNDYKLASTGIPSKETLLSLKSKIEQSGLEIQEFEVKKEKKIPVVNTSKIQSPSSEPNFDLEKTREDLKKYLSLIAKEFRYMMKVLENDEIDDLKKQYVVDFSMTKIGQIFVDSEKHRNQLLSVFPKDHQKSVKIITKNRHKLMHEIYASNSIDRRHVLYREALPVIPEIESLKKIASTKMDDDHALLTLGRAYTEMKCYDKAIECFDQMLQLSGSHFLSIPNIVSKEDVKNFGQASNALFGIAEAYGSAAYDALSAGLTAESQQYYKLKKHSIKQHLELLKHVDNIETPYIIPELVASTYNNLGNIYNYLGNSDKAFNSFKKAFQILKNQKFYESKREAIYLFNIGRTCFTKGYDTISNFIGTNIVSSEAKRNLSLALASFWAAKEIYESQPNNNKNDSFFLNLRICLIETLFFTAKEYHPYAIKLYDEFNQDLESFPIRESDDRFKYMDRVSMAKQLVEKMQSDQPHQEMFDNEFEIIFLSDLKSLYLELRLDDSIINEKLKKLTNHSQSLNPILIKEQEFYDLNLKACTLFRAGHPDKALPLFLKALECQGAGTNDLMAESSHGDLLESIGDTYISLNDPKNALKYLKSSLDTHLKNLPNDRSFFIPGKCLREINKIEKNRSKEKNQLFFKEMVDQFKAKVGENDPRMKTMMLVYKQIEDILPVCNEERILRQHASKITNTSKFLIIPKQDVVNYKPFHEHCEKFMNAQCREENGNYKIYLNETGKQYLTQLNSKK